MKMWKVLLPVTALLLFAGPADAQSVDEERQIAAEKHKVAAEKHKIEYAERLREAEERLEVAAREIAEITRERLPQMAEIERRIMVSGKPRMGITIDGDNDTGPVEGVAVIGVTPGTAADDAGLHAGDIITSVEGTTLSAESSMEANKTLLTLLAGVEEGDVLQVEYLRNGNVAIVEVSPRISKKRAFAWVPDDQDIHVQRFTGMPDIVREFRFDGGFPFGGGAWGSMELIELNEGLGKYFGTNVGLLVVSAPKLDGIELQDGDVIQSIDGREPEDVRHAMRILNSYKWGENLELGIMRDKKRRKLKIEVPADRRSSILAPPAVVPARASVHTAPPPHVVPPVDEIST